MQMDELTEDWKQFTKQRATTFAGNKLLASIIGEDTYLLPALCAQA